MSPQVFALVGDAPDPATLNEAAAIIRGGGLVAFPTETVYGLGADATNPHAIERLNHVKGRPPDKPYSWHLHSVDQLRQWVPHVPPVAERLITRFWPGPLTIVLPSRGGRTIGFRLPDHSIATAFLRACRVPVAAPSANRSGFPPSLDAPEVVAAFDGAIDGIVDGGPTRLGCESTVVEIIGDRVEIRRVGAIAAASILASVT